MDAITINKNGKGEAFFGNNEPAWHGLGTVVEGKKTAKEAIELASMNWTVVKKEIELVENQIKIPDYQAVCREDNGLALGVVKGRYQLIQNFEAFDFFDNVVGAGQAYYDTAGTLHQGRVIWIMAKIPGCLFVENDPEDKIEKNVLLVSSHDGSFSLMLQIVGLRVVCWNTLCMALEGATNRIKIRHTKKFNEKIIDAQRALQLTHAYFDNLQGLVNILAKIPMSKTEMGEFTKRLIPVDDEDEISARTLNIREKVETLFVNGKGNHGKSRWDALNAVTEYVDFHRTTKKGCSRFESGVLGQGLNMKERAVKLLVP